MIITLTKILVYLLNAVTLLSSTFTFMFVDDGLLSTRKTCTCLSLSLILYTDCLKDKVATANK